MNVDACVPCKIVPEKCSNYIMHSKFFLKSRNLKEFKTEHNSHSTDTRIELIAWLNTSMLSILGIPPVGRGY